MSFSVTVARAVDLKHKASLISALAYETSQLYSQAGNFCFTFLTFFAEEGTWRYKVLLVEGGQGVSSRCSSETGCSKPVAICSK